MSAHRGFADEGRMVFEHALHPWVRERQAVGPVTVASQRPTGRLWQRFNTSVGVKITQGVGTMWCAYLFVALAVISAPAAFATGDKIIIVSWVAQTFFQLVLLPIIIVGQNVQAAAADARSEATFKDGEAILSEIRQLADHLTAQDKVLSPPVV